MKDKNGRPVPVRADRDRPIQWFFEEVPSPDLDVAMQLSGDERFYRLHDALRDDVYRNTSPSTLCRRFGVSLQDLHELWRRHTLTLGLMRMANHLPAVMEGLSRCSMSREEACPQCDGIGCRLSYVVTNSSAVGGAACH
jgi:hypothetical protein